MTSDVENNDDVYKRDQASKWTKARKADKREGDKNGANKKQKTQYNQRDYNE